MLQAILATRRFYVFMYITDHTLHMYSVLFRQRSKQPAIIAILWFVFVSIVTASVTLVSCLIFQSILQCSLHFISQPPHIRYYNWTETTLRTPRVQSVKHGRINSLAGHTVYAHFHGFRGGLFLVHLFPSRVYTRCTLCILCTIA